MNKGSINFKQLIEEIVREHNIVRKNPQAYIPILEQQIKYFKGDVIERPDSDCGIQTNEGKAAYEECIEFLKRQEAVGELTLDEELSKAAQDHVNDIGPKGTCDHTGSDGSTIDSRISKYVDWNVTICENIDFGSVSGVDVVMSLIVDDGVPERGHRLNIFNPKLKFIGVGVGEHAVFDVMAVLDYCGHINSYIKDADKTPQVKNPEEEKQSRLKNLVNLINTREKFRHHQLHADKPSDHPILNYFNVVDTNGGVMKNYDNSELLAKDPEAPKNAIQVSTKVTTKKIGKRVERKITKTYTLDDGSTETIVHEEIEEGH